MTIKLLNIKEVQDTLGVSESTVFRLIRNKKLKGFKLGREWRFEETDIQALIKEQRKEAEEEVKVSR